MKKQRLKPPAFQYSQKTHPTELPSQRFYKCSILYLKNWCPVFKWWKFYYYYNYKFYYYYFYYYWQVLSAICLRDKTWCICKPSQSHDSANRIKIQLLGTGRYLRGGSDGWLSRRPGSAFFFLEFRRRSKLECPRWHVRARSGLGQMSSPFR